MFDKTSSILIVDDEQANILLLSKILQLKGYTDITTTVDPRETVVLHSEHNYDLVLLDINMPHLTGYEVLEQLRGFNGFSDTKVIATSGDVSDKDIKKALAASFNGYITKPMRMDNILDVVENVLQS